MGTGLLGQIPSPIHRMVHSSKHVESSRPAAIFCGSFTVSRQFAHSLDELKSEGARKIKSRSIDCRTDMSFRRSQHPGMSYCPEVFAIGR